MADWNRIFKEHGKVFVKVQEEMGEVTKYLMNSGSKNVLDLGCGSGRHTVFLAGKGFKVVAADISEEGLRLTKAWLKSKGLKASMKKLSCYRKFPFKDDSFDAVISTQTIHHNYHDKINFCISEIERVLKKDGVLFLTVAARKNWRLNNHSKLVAPRTYLPLEGDEKGLPHFIYNSNILKEDFRNFKIIWLHKKGGIHYSLLGTLLKKRKK